MPITTLLLSSIATLAAAVPVLAQQPCPCPPPAPPPPVWTGSASLGLGLTSGNSETRNFNVAFDVTRDPKTRHVFKAGLLYLWSSDDGDDTANRLAFQAREEYKLSDRVYIYGQGQYLRSVQGDRLPVRIHRAASGTSSRTATRRNSP